MAASGGHGGRTREGGKREREVASEPPVGKGPRPTPSTAVAVGAESGETGRQGGGGLEGGVPQSTRPRRQPTLGGARPPRAPPLLAHPFRESDATGGGARTTPKRNLLAPPTRRSPRVDAAPPGAARHASAQTRAHESREGGGTLRACPPPLSPSPAHRQMCLSWMPPGKGPLPQSLWPPPAVADGGGWKQKKQKRSSAGGIGDTPLWQAHSCCRQGDTHPPLHPPPCPPAHASRDGEDWRETGGGGGHGSGTHSVVSLHTPMSVGGARLDQSSPATLLPPLSDHVLPSRHPRLGLSGVGAVGGIHVAGRGESPRAALPPVGWSQESRPAHHPQRRDYCGCVQCTLRARAHRAGARPWEGEGGMGAVDSLVLPTAS